ncbi:hypothetical protein ACFZAC_15145 [Pseudomonas fluorescens]|uniref:GAP1-N1 domain-containing protein n=1 Tax=Pseudomonas fluorescens TaxID=294 RepID=UPI00374A6623
MSSILVHQALHGYNDGHRLISSSLTLDALDARVMLVMSDLSGPGMKPSPEGYLTGYPLENTGRYVFARTWAAPEMPRPGCVWTHSLIIENADLAKLVSAQSLLNVFRRPENGELRLAYGAATPVPLQDRPIAVQRTTRVESLLQSLYCFPHKQIVAEAHGASEDERIATAIWMQQWPRLRRAFGFCTLSGMERSGKGVSLDLQFVPDNDRLLRSKFQSAVVSDRGSISPELEPLLVDLVEPTSSTLREFLKRTGGDVDGGRGAMRPLCLLHSSLLQRTPPDLTRAVSALAALDGGGRKQARSVRTLVAKQALKSAGQVGDSVFDFLLEVLEQSSDPVEQDDMGDKLGVELWQRSPDRFYSALISDGALHRVVSNALMKIPPDQVVARLQSTAHLASKMAKRRPDILKLAAFWGIPEVDDELADYVLDEDAGLAAHALLAAGRTASAATIINKAPPDELVRALESDAVDPHTVKAWVSALCRNRNKLAAALASAQVKKMATIVEIARNTFPDDVPNIYGEDPWLTALRTGAGLIGPADKDFLAAYLLTRALGWESRSQAELLQYSYTRVYNAFRDRHFSREVEKLAVLRLEKNSWLEWDNCSRLTGTVANRFIEYDLDPGTFGRITPEPTLALSLIDEAGRNKKGRMYLKRVRDALRYSDEDEIRMRVDYIEKKLK